MPANRNKRRSILKIVVVVSIAITGCVQTPLVPDPKTENAGTISVADLDPKKVIGRLGYPLGTIVRVKGVVVDGNTLGGKMYAGRRIIRIETVNDKQLNQSEDFILNNAVDVTKKLKIGDRFEYYAHERGEFNGEVLMPDELCETDNSKGNRNYKSNIIGIDGPRFSYYSDIEIHDWKIPTPKKPS